MSKPFSRIPKPKKEVKGWQNLNEFYRQARDSEASGPQLPYRFHPSFKYWKEVLAALPANELKVFLHLRMIADWKTGEVVFSVRKQTLTLKINKETFDTALKALVQKEYLAKIKRQSRCWKYKVLKI